MCMIGMLFVYNVVVMIFGGFGLFIIVWLICEIGMKIVLSFYLMFVVVLSFVVLVVLWWWFGFC